MIKIDVISGFLGAGKTTFIKRIISAASKNGEKIVVVENEFGEAGIDGKMLSQSGLEIYEISKGCLCCSLKNDFVSTLSEIITKLSPDRIIVEPSGIFVLSEIYDIMKIPEISSACFLNSVLTIVDSLHFSKFRNKYNFFFENQIKYSTKLVLSKTENADIEKIQDILKDIDRLNPQKTVVADSWLSLSDDDILSLLNHDQNNSLNTNNKHNNRSKLNVMLQKNHGFNAFNIKPINETEQESLAEKLTILKSALFGKVLRAKGFIASHNGLLEFNYVDGEFDIKRTDVNIAPSINIIGEELNKESLSRLFS